MYENAGVDPTDDLARLTAARRRTPDVPAVTRLAVHSSTLGTVRVPTLTLHTTDDSTIPAEAERYYADQAASSGTANLLRQLFVTVAEQLTALGALTARRDTGRWLALTPQALTRPSTPTRLASVS